MLRIHTSKNSGQAKDYFTESLSRGDYYKDGQELPGRWGGKLAEMFGLSGEVKQHDFFDLCDNNIPGTKEPLTPRTKDGRRVGYDINFHVPKSVSLLYALGEDRRILEAFRECVTVTMRELETEMKTRVRVEGQQSDRHTGNMLWAEFIHTTARPVGGVPDPHLHAHCFTFNVTHDPIEGRFKAGEFEELKRQAGLFEARFHVRMAERMVEFGYEIVQKGKFWEVAGFSKELLEKFSRRTSEINKLAKDLGVENDPDRKAGLGAKTREKKRKGDSFEDLRQKWRESAGDAGMNTVNRTKEAAKGSHLQDPHGAAIRAVEYAILHSFERKSAVKERELWEIATRQAIGKSSVELVTAALEAYPFIKRTFKGQSWVTTDAVLKEEQRMIAFATESRGTALRIVRGVYEMRDKSLNAGQKAAVRHLLNSYDQVMLIRGGAGTGKTRLMTEAIDAMKRNGLHVVVLSPLSEVARQTLPKEKFHDAETVARFLIDKDLQNSFKLGVIWVDEAGLLGTRTMNQLFEIAKRNRCRVVLSGDDKQHKSVDRGDGISILVHEGGMEAAEVKDVIRQSGEYKEACEHLNSGHIDEGWQILKKLNFVIEMQGERAIADCHDAVAKEYVEAIQSGKSVLAVSPTHLEGASVTNAIRKALKEKRLIKEKDREFTQLKPLNFTEAEKMDVSNYKAGMFIEFNNAGRRRKSAIRGEVMTTKGNHVLIKGALGAVTPILVNIKNAKKFSVFQKDTISLAVGDTIRITRNGKTAGDILGFLPDRRSPLRNGKQIFREIIESLYNSEKQFRPNQRRLNNGSLYRVIKILPMSGDIVLNNGWVLPKNFGHIVHGYCSTSHGSQSKTLDRIIVAQTSMSFGMASNQEQILVSVSRGRERCSIFTDNEAELLAEVKKSGARLSASELVRDGEEQLREGARLAREQMTREQESERAREESRDHER